MVVSRSLGWGWSLRRRSRRNRLEIGPFFFAKGELFHNERNGRVLFLLLCVLRQRESWTQTLPDCIDIFRKRFRTALCFFECFGVSVKRLRGRGGLIIIPPCSFSALLLLHAYMHAMSQLDDALCGERNYEVRARNLFRHGATHGPPAPLTSDATTFEALSSLQIAKGAKGTAGAEAVATSCLRHPSALVRSAACRSGLLSPEAAKTVLLSPSTSLELRRLIVRECLQLPVDAATLDAANELDDNGSPHDRSHAWRLLQHQRCAVPQPPCRNLRQTPPVPSCIPSFQRKLLRADA